MKGIRFYLEYPEGENPKKYTRKNPGKHSGTVLAVLHENSWLRGSEWFVEAIGALQDMENSPACGTNVSALYIQENTKRISEEQAREIHPALFWALENVYTD
jgi:hypothetical protein